MRTIKNPKTLELEKESREELHSSEQMRKALTVEDAMPELTRIAIQENLNLTIGKEFKAAVVEMDRRNANR